jgi:hypothetical protein
MIDPGTRWDYAGRMKALHAEILVEQQAQAEEKRRLETAVRRIVREEIRSVLAEVLDRVADPFNEEAVYVVEDVRSRLEARWADGGHGPGSTV